MRTIDDIIKNLETLHRYLDSDDHQEQEFAIDLVRRGRTILVYKVNGKNCFAPSRWSGYKGNTMDKHMANDEKDGRETNPELDAIIKSKPFFNSNREAEFIDYCNQLGGEVPNNKRRYWRLRDVNQDLLNL